MTRTFPHENPNSRNKTEIMALTYIKDLPADKAQPIELRHQGSFVAIIQVDGAGPDEAIHHVLVDQDELDDFISRLQAMKQ